MKLPVPALPPAYIYLPTGSTAVSNPMDLYGYSRCRVYVKAASATSTIDVVVKGAPNENGTYTDELGPDARKSGITGEASFVLQDISRFIRVEVSNFAGSWTVWVVPIHT
ncbi:hypothetical protein V4V36_22015 [Paenibacillus lautus]|jgi:hypothetical protein|uniref:Uncharacterized protein n=1 Tax=Paenibacillus lautus TaxID=1401 RepID=A0A385TII9_PAELA|nr:hypothetical protein [Paenibacillus lautus]AYB42798.1 hypothetical protein D5F53_05660 [Paenibacillus lautus]MBY0160661.1 hypothetical protein [Cytobacillus firmus]MCI1773592.1 hypothetical protein [Paenibacillus lautus]VTR28164.1 Uncharacterised protein [Actinobacillus pleuropneumoniae]